MFSSSAPMISKCECQIQSRRPYIRASEAAVRVSLEGSESRVEPKVWRESVGESQGLHGDHSRGKGCVETTAGESLPAPRQSKVIGPRHSSRIAEERTGS